MLVLSDSLSARALEGLYNHYLPFHLAFTIHSMHSVVTPQYQQNTIKGLTIYKHSFHFKFPNDKFDWDLSLFGGDDNHFLYPN